MPGAINLANFLNTMKTNMTLGKMFYIRIQNSVKYQTSPRYFYVIYLPRVYLGSILFTLIFALFLRFYFLLQPSL